MNSLPLPKKKLPVICRDSYSDFHSDSAERVKQLTERMRISTKNLRDYSSSMRTRSRTYSGNSYLGTSTSSTSYVPYSYVPHLISSSAYSSTPGIESPPLTNHSASYKSLKTLDPNHRATSEMHGLKKLNPVRSEPPREAVSIKHDVSQSGRTLSDSGRIVLSTTRTQQQQQQQPNHNEPTREINRTPEPKTRSTSDRYKPEARRSKSATETPLYSTSATSNIGKSIETCTCKSAVDRMNKISLAPYRAVRLPSHTCSIHSTRFVLFFVGSSTRFFHFQNNLLVHHLIEI